MQGVYKSTKTKNDNEDAFVNIVGSIEFKFEPNITPIDVTTTSFAISPVNKETLACQNPNPNGINIGAKIIPIEYRKLFSMFVNPPKLKFDKNQMIIEIAKISVPIFFKNEYIF